MKKPASNLTPFCDGAMRATTSRLESGPFEAGHYSASTPAVILPVIRLVISFFLFLALSIPAYADYTIASGANINATALTGQSGILTINGTLTVSSNVSLLGFTSVVINGPSGQIYWTNNSDLTFSSGISISIANTAPGLMPTVGNGNASQRLIVGTTIISVSSDNSSVAAFSFEDFNEIGGLPQFTISSNSPVCNAAVSLTVTPDRTDPDIALNYEWSISPASGTFSANNTNSTTFASTTISPAAGTYTITCMVRSNGNIFASKSTSVSTNSTPVTPAAITGPGSICAPASTTISTTSAGSTIYWYNQATGGTSIGSSASGANFTITPAATTNYYAQAFNGSCPSSARTAVKTITVNTAPAITGTLSLCSNGTEQLTGSGTPAAATPWQSSATGVATVSATGLVTGVAAGTTTITYTNTNGCSKTALVTVLGIPVISGTTTVCMGTSSTLSATGTAAAVTPWMSASTGVATISNAGLVTPVTAGTSLITFTNSGGCAKTSVVTVVDLPVFSGTTSVCMGNTTQLSATGTPASAPAWVSASTAVATVNNIGLVTPVAAGTSNITFTNSYGCPKSILITVTAIPVLSGTTTVCMGNTTILTATGTPAAAAPWVSASTGVATVSNAGVITPVAAGTSVITFTNNGGCTKTTTVTVNQPAAITGQAVGSAVCMGSNTTLTVSAVGTGAIYQWEESSNGGNSWADLPVSALYSGITTNVLQVINPGSQVLLNSYRLRVSTPSGCGTTVWSNGAQFAFKNVWLGNTSTDWQTPANWMDGAVPTLSCPTVYIINRSFQPSLASGTAAVNNLVIYSGTLTVTNAVLSIAGSITNSGTLDVSDGTLNLNGSSLQTLAGSVFVNNTVKNLTINNPVGVSVISSVGGDSLNLSGALSFGAVNNSSLQTGDRVVLVSNAGGTARVSDITNNGVNNGNAIIGKVIIQRYFPARRAWRLFTAPVSGGGSVFDNWQNGGNIQSGIGTYVSAPQATNPMSANGLDWSLLNNSSLKMGTALSSVANTHTSYLSKNLADTSDNIPYFIFVRGDRDYANTLYPHVNTTTLSSKGKLQTGRQTFSASTALDGFTMIGNPYAAPIDFSKVTRNNIHKRMYVWDPYLNTDVGGYVLVDDVDDDGTYSISPASPGGLNQLIQSGQAFWIQTASNGTASLTFQETAKSGGNTNLTAFRPQGNIPRIAINVMLPAANNKTTLLDGFLVEYGDNFNKQLDMQDAAKFVNTKETIASSRGTSSYALERRPVIAGDDTIFIKLTKTTQRNYHLELQPAGFNEHLTAVLEDAFTGSKTTVPVSQTSSYNFNVTSAPASAAADRFRIVFRQIPMVIPPFKFVKIDARKEAGNIRVDWTVEHEISGNSYSVEKAVDGRYYTAIDSIVASMAGKGDTSYHTLDRNPTFGKHSYRVRYLDSSRQVKYSDTIEVIVSNETSGIGVYPNPVVDGVMNVAFNQMPAGNYVANLLQDNGAMVFRKEIKHPGGTSLLPVALDKETLQGIFLLQIHCPDNTIQHVKVLVK